MYFLSTSKCLLLLQVSFSLNALSADIQISFLVSKWYTCGNADNVFLKIPGLSITDCVKECAKRPRCKAVNFKGRIFCELLHSDSITDQAHCDCVRKSAMVVSGLPCEGCSVKQTCDLSSGQCVNTECIRPVVSNGTLFGNKYSIGGKIRLRCDPGFKEVNDAKTAVCLESGTWSYLLSCVQDTTANVAESETTETTTYAVTEPTTESTTDSMTEPTAESATDSVTEPTAESTTDSVTEPTVESTTDSVTEPTVESTTDSMTEPTAESTTDSMTEPTVESTTDSVTEPTVESTTDSMTEPTAESTTDSMTEPTVESTTDSVTETTTDPDETTNDCYSISAQATNDWCMINCNHVPPYCPTNFCQCN
ncbi:serine-rich adhesin for platelets-like [Mercenaria mercenaria]|uniref:serine-rich adhesin for platelets-like n=1 Tax=Mercenaria mercenaria TaxID=6596 RepID=UPI00234FAE1D|nr:serine-rich adhesin for platelets-like [Mercenaria mercenaria]